MIGKPAIDSLSLRIPVEEVEVITSKLIGSTLLVDSETAEVEGSKPKNLFSHVEVGIETTVKRARINIGQKAVECFLIAIPAKILRQDYFNGITANNIRSVYDYIISLGAIKFSFESFLNGRFTDTDIKTDYIIPGNQDIVIPAFMDCTIPKKESDKGGRPSNTDKKKIITWSKRKTTKYLQAPYFKIYHKQTELQYHERSAPFAQAYNIKAPGDLWRFEYTIKGSAHSKARFGKDNTLRNLLEVPSTIFADTLQDAMFRHIELKEYDYKPRKGTILPIQDYMQMIRVCEVNNINPALFFEETNTHIRNEKRSTYYSRKRYFSLALKYYNQDCKNIPGMERKDTFNISQLLQKLGIGNNS